MLERIATTHGHHYNDILSPKEGEMIGHWMYSGSDLTPIGKRNPNKILSMGVPGWMTSEW
jgi:hypothetical protein